MVSKVVPITLSRQVCSLVLFLSFNRNYSSYIGTKMTNSAVILSAKVEVGNSLYYWVLGVKLLDKYLFLEP